MTSPASPEKDAPWCPECGPTCPLHGDAGQKCHGSVTQSAENDALAPLLDQARRDAAEKAWDEGHEAGYTDGQTDILTPVGLPGTENPYRAVASHQEGGA